MKSGFSFFKPGYRLLEKGEVQKAVAIFKLATSLLPNNWNALDSLAEAYESAGQRAPALVSYQRSLALNPQNGHAAERLKALEGLPPH